MTPQQLRNSILQMAIEGKLTKQRPEDGNAADLLKEIKAEKAKLVKEGKIKKEKPLPEITEEEIPFEVPDNWCWCRLGEIATTINGDRGKNYPKKEEYVQNGVAWINTGHILPTGYLTKDYMNYITEEKYNLLGNGKVIQGDLLYCLRGATFGKVARIEPYSKGAIASSLMIIRLHHNNEMREYIYTFLRSPMAKRELRRYDNGSAQPNLAAKDVAKYLIPLPPLAEQQRIVAQLEKILPQVDAYEKAYNELQELNKTFPSKLKNSLLQLAIQGKLVEQRPEEGNAADLLKEIQAEKAKLVKEKKIKKEKTLPKIAEEEMPFEIPASWCWCRLGEVFTLQAGKNISSSLIYDSGRYLCYGGNGVRGYVDCFNCEGSYPIIGRQGALCGNVNVAKGKFYATEHAVVVYLYAATNYSWAAFFLQALNLNQYATATAQPGLAVNKINEVLIPLPPIAEQKRIVAKLEQLLPLCDALQAE